MARIRTTKPDIWTDEKFVELTFPARLLFVGLWNFCDREGRMVYSPARIKMQIFPADSIDVTPLIAELEERGMVCIYQATNARILSVPNWHKHQHINAKEAPSILPANAAVTTVSAKALDEYPPKPVQAPAQHHKEGKGKEGKGRESTPCVEQEKPCSPLMGTLPLITGSDFGITKLEMDEWQHLYPAVDVKQEFRSMKGWLIANPTRRKTKSGIKKFINNWLSKQQNRGGGNGNGNGRSTKTDDISAHNARVYAEVTQRRSERMAAATAAGDGGDDASASTIGGSGGPVLV